MTQGDWQDIPQEERDLLSEGNIQPLLLENHGQIPGLMSNVVGKIPSTKQKKGFSFRVDLDAGHYLFQAREFNRAYELLGIASDTLQGWGRAREGLSILKPFLEDKDAKEGLAPLLMESLLGIMGLGHFRLAEVGRAIEYYEKALAISREIGDRTGEGNRLGNLGTAYKYMGQANKEIECCKQALVIHKEIGDRRGEGIDFGNLGGCYADLGKANKAIEYNEKALGISREIDDRRSEGYWLGNLGGLMWIWGKRKREKNTWEIA